MMFYRRRGMRLMLYSIEEKGEVANQRGGWMLHIVLTGGEPEWCMVLPRWADSNQNQTLPNTHKPKSNARTLRNH
jgi:hypothetical protein